MRQAITKRAVRAGRVRRDAGSSGVELVVGLGVLGVAACTVTLMVTGMTTQAADTSCLADAASLGTATVAYLTTSHATSIAPAVTADGDTNDRYELTLVRSGFLRRPSELHDLTPSGAVIPTEESSC